MALPTNDHPHRPPVAVAEAREPEISQAVRESRHPMVTVLSILIPGAGHLVKGRKRTGIVLLVGAILVLVGAVLLASGTYGLGLLLIPAYWISVALHAFSIRADDEKDLKR